MPRNHKKYVNFTKEEFERISKKAKHLGVDVTTYLRMVALASEITIELKTAVIKRRESVA